MSLSRKKTAKALRIRYGVAGGVRPRNRSIEERKCGIRDGLGDLCCNQPTKVVSAGVPLCEGHFADEARVRRR